MTQPFRPPSGCPAKIAEAPVGHRGPLARTLFHAAALVATLMLVSPTPAHERTHKTIKIVHPWVPETQDGEVALRVTLKNSGAKADRLLAASTPVATRVAIVDGGGKEGRGLPIPAHGELALAAEGPHILLSGLKKPLYAYDDFEVTFEIERVGAVKVDVIVEEGPSADKAAPGG
jgi:copper(I)-binding protein